MRPERFDVLYYSPLARASQTATIVWGDRKGRIKELPSLREIDLYNFQVIVDIIALLHTEIGFKFTGFEPRAGRLHEINYCVDLFKTADLPVDRRRK